MMICVSSSDSTCNISFRVIHFVITQCFVYFKSLCTPIIWLQLALYVLSFLEPRDLLRAAQTCRSWRFLAEDNLLWREKCREAGIDEVRETIHRRRQRVPSVTSPWKVSVLFTSHPNVIHFC